MLSDREVLPLVSREVSFNQAAIRAAEVIERVRKIFAYADLSIWVGGLVVDFHDSGTSLQLRESAVRPRRVPSPTPHARTC
jgi:hypothetical protein